MRRWNGWGDDTIEYLLTPNAIKFLEEILGSGIKHEDALLGDVVKTVQVSQLKNHALISLDPEVRVRHARGQSFPDWIALRSGAVGGIPDGVAFPTSDEDVSVLIQLGKDSGARLIPYGGGTSVVGHINPIVMDQPIITIDLSRMNRLLNIDDESHLANFGTGVTGSDLEAQLRARGFTLGHFPQSFEYSTLGGWIATRSSGQQSMGYGRIDSNFAGGILQTPLGRMELPSFPASAAGPDLRNLVLGSEGRLGVITSAVVCVSPLPEREDFHAIFFPDWLAGFEAVKIMTQARLPLSMLRYSTPVETQTTLALAGHENLIGILDKLLGIRGIGGQKCMLLVGFTGKDSLVKMVRKEVLDIARNHNGVHVGRAFGTQWQKSRFRTPYLRNSLWGEGYGIDTLETAVTWNNVNQTLIGIEGAIKTSAERDGDEVHVFSHLSHTYQTGSSIYTTYLFKLDNDLERTLERWKTMKEAASQVILMNKGTISHQHGVGIDHSKYLPVEKGEIGIAAIKSLCDLFDPDGLMNPGKLVTVI